MLLVNLQCSGADLNNVFHAMVLGLSILLAPLETSIPTPPTSVPDIPTATLITISPTSNAVELGSPSGMFGPPSLWPEDIDAILKKRGSPAYGNGQGFWDLGVAYGIDPAYLLAFFAKESSMGADPNWRQTNNVGNIICTQSCTGRFRSYDSWYAGAEDWYSLMSRKYSGMDIYSILRIYAPASDGNNPDAYAATVEQLVNQWRTR